MAVFPGLCDYIAANLDNDAQDEDMTKMPRDEDGLTVVEAKAAALCARGFTQSEAYRQATGTTRAKPETVHKRASDMFKRAHVQGRVRELLRLAKVQDIETVGESYAKMLEDMEAARTDQNHNAVMGYTRIKMQAHGMLRDNVSMTMESSLSDEELLQRMAGADPARIAAMRVILGAQDSFGETKH